MKDKKLLEKLKKGDVAALDGIITLYSPYLCAVVSNVFAGRLPAEDVEEVVSDSFVTLWRNAADVKEGKLKSFLATVARNAAISRLRGLNLDSTLEDDYPISICRQPEQQAVLAELSELARQAVASMPEPEREIFIRHYFLFQKTGDISKQLGINAATVRTKLRRGRERLRKKFAEWGYEYEDTYI